MDIRIEETDLEGVAVLHPEAFEDERGFFFESYSSRTLARHGIDLSFVQDNHSRSARNVVRGLHFQDASAPQHRLVRCTVGVIWDVVVDIRVGSPTFGQWFGTELSADNRRQLLIGPAFAHGFAVLSDVAEVQYKCTGLHNAAAEGSLRWDDPTVAIDWPVDEPILSARDRSAPGLDVYLQDPAFTAGALRWEHPMSLEGRSVVVTGGAGFIGSSLVRALLDAGASVTVVDNLVNGTRDNLAEVLGPRCQLRVADVRDRAAMTVALTGADVVFHLACLGVRHSIHAPVENHDVNASGTLTLLETARRAGVGRFVYVSSSEVYGTARYAPMPEDHPTEPLTVYGASKLAGERYTHAYFRTYEMETVVVRPFNAFGPRCHHEGDSGEVIPKFMLRCLAGLPMVVFGDGTQTRDFTFVTDTARGIMLAGTTDAAVGRTINLGAGAEITVRDLADQVAAVVGRPDAEITSIEPRPGDVLRLCADSSLARELLSYEPEVGLGEGLAALATGMPTDPRLPNAWRVSRSATGRRAARRSQG